MKLAKTDDLMAVAHVGYHYLMNGAYELAEPIFAGLVALERNDPYFVLALGLVRDHLGDTRAAHGLYRRAAELDPRDPRPDLNRAELFVAAGDRPRARTLVQRALKKAHAAGHGALADKASALLRHLAGGG